MRRDKNKNFLTFSLYNQYLNNASNLRAARYTYERHTTLTLSVYFFGIDD